MKFKKKHLCVISSILVVLTIMALIIFKPHKSGNLLAGYDFVTVKRMDLSERIDATGTVTALIKKDLYADYEGSVEKINVKGGDLVKKGDLLLIIDSSSLKEQWREADSALKQAQFNLTQATAQLATEIAINKVQQSNALQLESYSHQVVIYKEQVKQAKERLDALNAKNDGYYVSDNEKLFIRAPFNGQVAWVNVNQGEKITPQSLLATIMQPDALSVEAQIDQNDINLIKTGQKAEITGKDTKHSLNAGLVTAVSTIGHNEEQITVTGVVNPATEGVVDFPVQIKLIGESHGLQPGMTVDVTVLANERTNVLAIPAAGIIHKNGQNLVNIKKGNKILQVAVDLGFSHGKYWEVKSGVKAGQQIAVPKMVIATKPTQAPGGGARLRMSPFGR